jgi:hypothetical protein
MSRHYQLLCPNVTLTICILSPIRGRRIIARSAPADRPFELVPSALVIHWVRWLASAMPWGALPAWIPASRYAAGGPDGRRPRARCLSCHDCGDEPVLAGGLRTGSVRRRAVVTAWAHGQVAPPAGLMLV